MKNSALIVLVPAFVLAACSSTPNGYGVAAPPRIAEDTPPVDAAPYRDSQTTYLALINRMQQNGLWFASLAHVDALEQQWGRSPDSQRLRADALRQTGQAEQSEKIYLQLAGTPQQAAASHGRGLIAAARGDFAQAAELLEAARRQTPTDALLLNDLGYAQLRAGRLEAARMPLMQAQQLQPDNPKVLGNIALLLLAEGKPGLAQTLMEESRLPVATRAAIAREAARLDLPTAASATATDAAQDPPQAAAGAPLVLKASGWMSARIQGTP
ncbi:tetratricopeptide repeat protein [Xylophilus sp. ASV27]|uniref:tetratricopeptide repeat protein n=1 Tax=Xylophilus sp. ASV27 TaxID=2795129 RepID=UPI0018ED4CB2|nr:tetratricopeptide repeat protein [Xylophilus sp. ASV27]